MLHAAIRRAGLAVVAVAVAGTAVGAQELMPDLGNVTTGAAGPGVWYQDRYSPAVFQSTTYQGRQALEIGISEAQSQPNRPAAYSSAFYNTQGMKYDLDAPITGASLSADLYVEDLWQSASNGLVRTDMWAGAGPGSGPLFYPIIGFTNEAGTGLFRVWDAEAGGWQNLASAVQYGSWNSLAINFTGTTYEFFVNGVLAYTDLTDGQPLVEEVIMQAYNFGSTSQTPEYSVHWSNAQVSTVPEPATVLLLASGLAGLGVIARRRQQRAS